MGKQNNENDLRRAFIHELATYLVGNQVVMSIKLEMGDKDAKLWAKIRGLSPLSGYPTVEEAEKTLGRWLLGND